MTSEPVEVVNIMTMSDCAAFPGPEASNAPGWFVVMTKPLAEHLTRGRLAREGVASYLPTHSPSASGDDSADILFPGLLFVYINLACDWGRVMSTPGIRGFLSAGLVPMRVKELLLDFLRRQQIRPFEADRLDEEPAAEADSEARALHRLRELIRNHGVGSQCSAALVDYLGSCALGDAAVRRPGNRKWGRRASVKSRRGRVS